MWDRASTYYAHSGTKSDQSDWQKLHEHLHNVATLAQQFAMEVRPTDAEFAQAAYQTGLLHDLGKYREEFQEMILGRRGRGELTRHKQIGAAYTVKQNKRIDLAFAILGHHGGLPDKATMVNDVFDAQSIATSLLPFAQQDCPEIATVLPAWGHGVDPFLADLRIRLLFSCLVDADWLDTSEHHDRCLGRGLQAETPTLRADLLLGQLRAYIAERARGCRDPQIAELRAEVLTASAKAAAFPIGLFSMAVPTGGGKTLSSMAFALEHAQRHDLRRIIYVAPYLSIIEQNARIFRDALGSPGYGLILEHHSLAEPGVTNHNQDDTASGTAQRLAENWDAPIVLTTSVQFYETLFSNEPGRCRKLHNIARSVIILDECQTLPAGFIAPTCQMLQQIQDYLGCTILLCTATQPAWMQDDRLLPQGIKNVREIIPSQLDLYRRLKRVAVTWPHPDAPPLSWSEVAVRMLKSAQALCVVNSKQAARELFAELRQRAPGNVYHLSTAMCPAHRLQVLDQVRHLLAESQPCQLVSTQLIEAGVDIDFPLLLRELAPLESIVQAAGRCNREGLLRRPDGQPGGEVVVFQSVDGTLPPDGWYRNGTAIVAQDFLRQGRQPDIHLPADLAEYFRRLYPTGDCCVSIEMTPRCLNRSVTPW